MDLSYQGDCDALYQNAAALATSLEMLAVPLDLNGLSPKSKSAPLKRNSQENI
jgi:hypothetical protein